MNRILLIPFLLSCILISCQKDNPATYIPSEEEVLKENLNLPQSPYNYSNLQLPAFFEDQFIKIQNNTPANNPTTDWGASLGRVLFYDKDLSLNHTISCASCHQQQFGFTDTAQFSMGFKNGHTKRHSMSLINAVFYINGRFFWDERAASLEEQVLKPIQDSVEMGLSLDTLVNRIKSKSYYPILFKRAFNQSQITSDLIAKALAQFIRSMISYQSKYDIGRSQTNDNLLDFPNFTPTENLGKKIYMTNANVNCSGCHFLDVFILDNARNNGIHIDNQDLGTYTHTQNTFDIGKFKTPTLKNVMLRNRFMHDGSFVGIESVLEHYNHGILPNPNLDNHLINISNGGVPQTMNLTPQEVNALKSFLETLTDYKIISEEKYSNPFK